MRSVQINQQERDHLVRAYKFIERVWGSRIPTTNTNTPEASDEPGTETE